jgi:hypothetical protein
VSASHYASRRDRDLVRNAIRVRYHLGVKRYLSILADGLVDGSLHVLVGPWSDYDAVPGLSHLISVMQAVQPLLLQHVIED